MWFKVSIQISNLLIYSRSNSTYFCSYKETVEKIVIAGTVYNLLLFSNYLIKPWRIFYSILITKLEFKQSNNSYTKPLKIIKET